MPNRNSVSLWGHVGRDPETRATPWGSTSVSFALATTEYWVDKKTGEKQSRTEWHNVECVSQSTVEIAETLIKGEGVAVEGSIRYEEWDDKKTGEKRRATKIRAAILSPLKKVSLEDKAKPAPKKTNTNNLPKVKGDFADLEDDIPF